MDRRETLDWLHASLARRDTPETVAERILAVLPNTAGDRLRDALARVAGHSTRRAYGWTSMSERFRAPDTMDRQVAKATELAGLFLGASIEGDDADALDDFVDGFSALIGRVPGKGDFKADRLDGAARAAMAPGLSRRRYVKLFRLAGRLEGKLRRLRREEAKYRLVLVGKAALAPDVTREMLGDHLPAAAFVAYYAARMKLRSEFTIKGQQMPFDGLAEELLALCSHDPETPWLAVAHVFPRADVLSRLDQSEKGNLLGRWFSILDETACLLEDLSARTEVDLQTMVVRRGNDSTTWNLLASAWNRSRDHWIALCTALGMDDLLDVMMPGKVMRLMAGDVVAWHGGAGGGIHPDTRVWAALPKPWEVVGGQASCSREAVEAACRLHGVDAAKSGWSRPREHVEVASYRPTPELVHGVTVHNPFLADALRRMGAFSGKPAKGNALVSEA